MSARIDWGVCREMRIRNPVRRIVAIVRRQIFADIGRYPRLKFSVLSL
jgi:hypothetical protein